MINSNIIIAIFKTFCIKTICLINRVYAKRTFYNGYSILIVYQRPTFLHPKWEESVDTTTLTIVTARWSDSSYWEWSLRMVLWENVSLAPLAQTSKIVCTFLPLKLDLLHNSVQLNPSTKVNNCLLCSPKVFYEKFLLLCSLLTTNKPELSAIKVASETL